jgi:hypothetical protein
VTETILGPRVPRGRIVLATGIDAVRLGVRGVLVRRDYVVYEAANHDMAMNLLYRVKDLDALVLGADLPPDGGLALLDALADPPSTLLLTAAWMKPPPEVLERYPTISDVVARPFALGYLLDAVQETVSGAGRGARATRPGSPPGLADDDTSVRPGRRRAPLAARGGALTPDC